MCAVGRTNNHPGNKLLHLIGYQCAVTVISVNRIFQAVIVMQQSKLIQRIWWRRDICHTRFQTEVAKYFHIQVVKLLTQMRGRKALLEQVCKTAGVFKVVQFSSRRWRCQTNNDRRAFVVIDALTLEIVSNGLFLREKISHELLRYEKAVTFWDLSRVVIPDGEGELMFNQSHN